MQEWSIALGQTKTSASQTDGSAARYGHVASKAVAMLLQASTKESQNGAMQLRA